MGDIHGNYRGYKQCIERSKFRNDVDKLIQLGDVADRLPETVQVVEHLQSIKNLVALRGNHDVWIKEWLASGTESDVWMNNGLANTILGIMTAIATIAIIIPFFI